MQRLLFLLPSFQLGGTNSSFNSFLSKIDRKRFSIDVFAFDDKGPNRAIVAKYANIIGGNDAEKKVSEVPKRSMKDVVRSVKRILLKLHIDISPLAFRKVASQLSAQNYEIVIAFQEGQTTKFLTYFNNTFKIAWVHCDYRDHIAINHIQPEKEVYSKIDRIVCVSKYTQDMFLSVLPDMKDKTQFLHNAMDVEAITEKSKQAIEERVFGDEKSFKLVSIGRLDPVKRFHLIPQIANTIKKQGYSFRWLIIGGGSDDYLAEIKQFIKKFEVEDCVICIGAKPNPYPYLANADMMVILSTSEACPMVLNEAKILEVPVVTTDYGSACEFIENEKNGIISTIDNISQSVISLMKNHELYNNIKCNLAKFEYPNDAIMCEMEEKILKK